MGEFKRAMSMGMAVTAKAHDSEHQLKQLKGTHLHQSVHAQAQGHYGWMIQLLQCSASGSPVRRLSPSLTSPPILPMRLSSLSPMASCQGIGPPIKPSYVNHTSPGAARLTTGSLLQDRAHCIVRPHPIKSHWWLQPCRGYMFWGETPWHLAAWVGALSASLSGPKGVGCSCFPSPDTCACHSHSRGKASAMPRGLIGRHCDAQPSINVVQYCFSYASCATASSHDPILDPHPSLLTL